ncbi:MAG: DUF4360 domain-containing protein [Bdellovibrio sp.]|nr:DUF4360 domain-containing protein [Bdellovibrio sp.]
MQNKFVLFVATLALSVTSLAQTAAIRGVRLSGSGCSDSTATAVITPDGQTLSILFDNYSVEIGDGSKNPQALTLQKDCHVLIDVDVPANMQFGLQQADYRGFAAIPDRAYGIHRFTHITANQPGNSMKDARIMGPTSGNYVSTVMQKPGRFAYTVCNQRSQTVDLFSQLSVSYLPSAREHSIAMINLDSVDTGVSTTFKLNWRACR